mgnify:CR=1 FL=1
MLPVIRVAASSVDWEKVRKPVMDSPERETLDFAIVSE